MFSPAHEIAAAAARCIVEEGLAYGPAKRRALQTLGWPPRTPLPDNEVVEDAVREYLSVFCADTQPIELRALRELALEWMQQLCAFTPHLVGAVWNGTATRLSDVHLRLYGDDPKAVEIDLINRRLSYDTHSSTGVRGQLVEVLSLNVWCRGLQEHVGLHLSVLGTDDVRGALKPDAKGRKPQGTWADVQRLLMSTAE
jgi:hypothetical protein